MSCLGIYSYGQATYVVENGYTYTRVLTHDEFVSIGGNIVNENNGTGAYTFLCSVKTLSCDQPNGNCVGVTMTTDGSGNITSITIPEQCDSTGLCITSPINGTFAYYNSENKRIIFR